MRASIERAGYKDVEVLHDVMMDYDYDLVLIDATI